MWASTDPPGDLEFVAATLFGDASPENVARLTNGHAVMAVFTRGEGTVFNAGSANWCYGLGADPLVEQITRNVVDRWVEQVPLQVSTDEFERLASAPP